MIPDTSAPATLIIGLGNPLRGDDGVGPCVAQTLAEYALSDKIQVIDGGTPGLGLINLMEGRQRVILVDAADIGKSPGQFARFTLPEARLLGDDHQHLGVHSAGLREALLLAQALEMMPPDMIIFGVQPKTLDWDRALSSEVEAGLPALISAILAEVTTGNE